jgi:hypothetical protein
VCHVSRSRSTLINLFLSSINLGFLIERHGLVHASIIEVFNDFFSALLCIIVTAFSFVDEFLDFLDVPS